MSLEFVKSSHTDDIVNELSQTQPPGTLAARDLTKLTDLIGKIQRLPHFTRCNLLSAPDAPGVVIAAGELQTALSATTVCFTGSGISLFDALSSALGEAVEIRSLELASAPSHIASTKNNLKPSPIEAGWINLFRNHSTVEQEIIYNRIDKPGCGTLPAILSQSCGPGENFEYMPPSSSGLGAGLGIDAAARHGMLELVEHAALANWWFGLHPANLIDQQTLPLASRFLERCRRDIQSTNRHTVLFRMKSDVGIPVVGAASFDKHGQCFSCGTAARMDSESAAIAALREMCQIEFGHHCVRAKMEQSGVAALTTADCDYISRAQIITFDRFVALLHQPDAALDPHRPAWLNELVSGGTGVPTATWMLRLPAVCNPIVTCKLISPLLPPLSAGLWQLSDNSRSLHGSPWETFEHLLP